MASGAHLFEDLSASIAPIVLQDAARVAPIGQNRRSRTSAPSGRPSVAPPGCQLQVDATLLDWSASPLGVAGLQFQAHSRRYRTSVIDIVHLSEPADEPGFVVDSEPLGHITGADGAHDFQQK